MLIMFALFVLIKYLIGPLQLYRLFDIMVIQLAEVLSCGLITHFMERNKGSPTGRVVMPNCQEFVFIFVNVLMVVPSSPPPTPSTRHLQGTTIECGEQGTGITESSHQQIDKRWKEFSVSLCGV